MDQTEFQALFEANAELNSPEVQAAIAEQRTLLEEQKQPIVEPLEAKLHVPYTDTAEYDQKLSKIEQSLQDIRKAQETERLARIEAETKAGESNQRQVWENRIWQTVIVIIGVLTLAATIFGVLKQ